MRTVAFAGLTLLAAIAATPAQAVEHTLVRWKKTGLCEIVTHLPLWGSHWVVLGTYDSKVQAERALSVSRKARACPEDKSARTGPNPLDKDKGPFAHRGRMPGTR
jgi:hypothetical protein